MWLLTSLCFLSFYYMYKKIQTYFCYWSERGVTGPKVNSIFGNIQQAVWPKQYSFMTISAKIYEQFQNEKVVGIYQGFNPTLIVRDPEMIKTILIKDFAKFNDRGISLSKHFANIFSSEKEDWQIVRNHLSHVFTTKKLRELVPELNKNVEKYIEFVQKLVTSGSNSTKIRTLSMKYTLNAMSSVAFGVNFDTYDEEMTKVEKTVNYIAATDAFGFFVLYLIKTIIPEVIFKKTIPLFYPNENFRYFQYLVKRLLQERKNGSITREDLLESLIALEKTKNNGFLDTNNHRIVNETIFFFIAGSDSSASTMAYLLYELALDIALQDRCLVEIDAVMKKYNNVLDYDALTKELPCLNLVIEETLRKYPVGGLVVREALTDYKFEDINLSIKKGTKIWIPILGFHRDQKYFSEPEKFCPDRFLPKNRLSIKDFYYPFGSGPKTCLGARLANLQILLVITHFLHKFRVGVCDKTTKSVQFDPYTFNLTPKNDIWLNITKRE